MFAGTEVKCENGTSSETGFTPNCSGKYQRITGIQLSAIGSVKRYCFSVEGVEKIVKGRKWCPFFNCWINPKTIYSTAYLETKPPLINGALPFVI